MWITWLWSSEYSNSCTRKFIVRNVKSFRIFKYQLIQKKLFLDKHKLTMLFTSIIQFPAYINDKQTAPWSFSFIIGNLSYSDSLNIISGQPAKANKNKLGHVELTPILHSTVWRFLTDLIVRVIFKSNTICGVTIHSLIMEKGVFWACP